MTKLSEGDEASKFSAGSTSDSVDKVPESNSLEQKTHHISSLKSLSNFFSTTFSIFEASSSSSPCTKKEPKARNYGWTAAVRRAMIVGSMRRLQERLLGTSKADVSSSSSEVWLLGTCYKVAPDDSSSSENSENGLAAFHLDFSSRIWITYRKGFDAIGDSNFTSDVNWGCMIRSSQMLVAQALVFHYLGRSWRKPTQKPYDPKYIELLHLFGDSETSAFSIHNLLHAGKAYGLASGSWVGPYAMCRSWEILSRNNKDNSDHDKRTPTLPMAVYIVSGDEDGERGGAPVVCIDVASRLCSNFCEGEITWAPILLLVPLVLGLDKVNPRYLPLLSATFTFPQSLGILGGKPGASTYIVGVQDDKALYLDPHEVQAAVDISKDNLEADTSSYHCSTVRHLPLEQMDPSLAIGFYCRDKDDFGDFCARAYDLVEKSNGAPLFTVAESFQPPKHAQHNDDQDASSGEAGEIFDVENVDEHDTDRHEDDSWQLL